MNPVRITVSSPWAFRARFEQDMQRTPIMKHDSVGGLPCSTKPWLGCFDAENNRDEGGTEGRRARASPDEGMEVKTRGGL